jgi:hypothetical protein
MLKDFTRANYLSLIAILLSLIVIVFGNNFLERLQKARLYYKSQDVELQYPEEKINSISKKNKDSVLKFYRAVKIMNVKKISASDLKIFVNTNGEIKASKAFSIEDVVEAKIDSGVMKFSLHRLVNGADVVCQFWFLRKPGSLSIKYIDNEGLKEVKNIVELDDTNYFALVGGLVIILLLIGISYSYFLSPLLTNLKELEFKNVDLQLNYDIVRSELDELRRNQAEVEPDNVVEALTKILNAHKKIGH